MSAISGRQILAVKAGFCGMGRYPNDNLKLTAAEIERSFGGTWNDVYPPILSVAQAARLAQVSPRTLYDWSHRGLLMTCAHRRGKRLRIFRDRFVRFLSGCKG